MKLLNRALLLSLLLWCCVAQGTPGLGFDKQALINQAVNWVALEAEVNKDQVIIKATDRRLKIPTCPSLFDIAFSFPTSQESIRVKCPDTGWSAFIGVKLIKYSKVLTFSRNMSAGDKITRASLNSIELPNRISGAISSKAVAEGMTLKKDVKTGDLVLQSLVGHTATVFMLKKDILSGEKITIDDVTLVEKSIKKIGKQHQFPLRLLSSATASSNLLAGTILSKKDVNIETLLVMSTATIQRGQIVSSANVKVQPFYGKVPNDALIQPPNNIIMQARRTIRAGQIIRASDLQEGTLVTKGDSILLVISKGALEISTPMVAKENGKIGQQITLINPESGEQVKGVIIGPGKASGL
ncbi:MAG: flagellar basal body P-ring formation chaperone FlgA [Porticoccaceae bacterium]|nr:flagellar basal body P-ring formation chaperone FlgA [Porticoccaceae bacterium]